MQLSMCLVHVHFDGHADEARAKRTKREETTSAVWGDEGMSLLRKKNWGLIGV